MTYDPYGQYDPHRQQQPGAPGQQYPQQPQYPQPPQYPPPQPQYGPPTPPDPYGQPASPGPYGQPGSEDPTAPVSYGGGQYGSSGQYGGASPGGTQVSGSPYGGSPYSGPPYSGPPFGGGPFGSPQSPAGWPPPAPAAHPKRSTGLVVGLIAGGLALVVCLGGLGFFGLRALNDDPGGDPTTSPPDPVATGDPGGGDPWAGTPAEGFADGEAAIVLPQAEAVGDFSADQVAGALDQVQQALVATRIDATMLVDRNPRPFIEMMAEDNRDFLREDFDSGNFGYFASQIADGAELAVETPRAEGTIEYDATTDEQGIRVIEVQTKFVWAYAFVPPGNDPELDGIVVVKDELTWQVPHPEDVIETSNGLWLWQGEAYAWGIDCPPFEQSLLAPQTELRFDFGAGGPEEGEVFDPNSSLDFEDTC